MARSRGRAFNPVRRAIGMRPKRATEWNDYQVNETVTVGNANLFDLTQKLLDDEKKGATLVRLLIHIAALAQTAGTGSLVALGIQMLDDDALAANAHSEPGSMGEQPGWMWRAFGSVFTSVVNDSSQQRIFEVDLKARRRLRGQDQNVVLILHNISGASTINFDGMVRVLHQKA